MKNIPAILEGLIGDAYAFLGIENTSWLGSSGTDVDTLCRNPAISKLDSAKTGANNVEQMKNIVNSINSEISAIASIDESIAQYQTKLNQFYSLSALKRAALGNLDVYYINNIESLKAVKAEHVRTMNEYKSDLYRYGANAGGGR